MKRVINPLLLNISSTVFQSCNKEEPGIAIREHGFVSAVSDESINAWNQLGISSNDSNKVRAIRAF